MFGKNVVMSQLRAPQAQYWVQEVFPTIQGEGPMTGMPAVFVRMAGCNLKCHFCDTDFESSQWRPNLKELLVAIEKALPFPGLVVFTGGEPLRQPLGPVVRRLRATGRDVQIETAGTLWDESITVTDVMETTWVCSPKTPKIHPNIAGCTTHYKYIVRTGDKDPVDGLPMLSTQSPGVIARPYRCKGTGNTIWVQPCDEYDNGMPDKKRSAANVRHAIDLCLTFGYRLSLQTHKMIGMP